MARISYTERSEWRSRIEKRFQNAINNVKSDNSLDWDNINKIAEQKAHDSLGVAAQMQQVSQIKDAIEKLEAEQIAIENELILKLVGKKLSNTCFRTIYRERLREMIQARADVFRHELLLEHSLGQKLVLLEREKESVIDTILLAASSNEIRDLWLRVTKVLGETPTVLQTQLLISNDTADSTDD